MYAAGHRHNQAVPTVRDATPLQVLGGLDAEEPEQLSLPLPKAKPAPPGTQGINYFSVVCLLRGCAGKGACVGGWVGQG